VRIAVSGSHCCGKSTLIADFLAAHPEFVHEPEPYEWLQELYGEEFGERPSAGDFYRQLEVSVQRLATFERGANVIVERSPADFVAYLLALQDLGRDPDATELIDSATALAARGLSRLDLVVFLPLSGHIAAPDSEDLELREAANDRLAEFLHGDDSLTIIEVAGTRAERLAALTACIELMQE
jgi:hypothetical protein